MVITDEFREKVNKAARSVTGGTAGYDWEDVSQNVWVRLVEDQGYYLSLLELADPFASLKRMAKQEVYKMNNAWEFYSGQYTYTPGEVRGLLGEYLLDVDIESISEHVDLVEGLLLLRTEAPSYFKYVIDKHVHGVDVHRGRLGESIDKLTILMNQVNRANRYSYEGPGSRKALTNSQAIARKDN